MPTTTEGDIVTKKGLDLIAKTASGVGEGKLIITRASVGDGALPEGTTSVDIRNFTNIIHEVMPADIVRSQFTGNGEALLELMVSSDGVATGFHVTELAVFVEDPDEGEILYDYVSLHEDPEWIRPDGAAVGKVARFTLILKVGGVSAMEVHFTPGSMVAREELEAHYIDPEAHPEIRDKVTEEIDKKVEKKVDKEPGKSLISITEIERLKTMASSGEMTNSLKDLDTKIAKKADNLKFQNDSLQLLSGETAIGQAVNIRTGGHEVSATPPADTKLLWVDAATHLMKYHDGSSWESVAGIYS